MDALDAVKFRSKEDEALWVAITPEDLAGVIIGHAKLLAEHGRISESACEEIASRVVAWFREPPAPSLFTETLLPSPESPSEEVACWACDYFNAGLELKAGECRRNPPRESGSWPRVENRDWCGEFRKA